MAVDSSECDFPGLSVRLIYRAKNLDPKITGEFLSIDAKVCAHRRHFRRNSTRNYYRPLKRHGRGRLVAEELLAEITIGAQTSVTDLSPLRNPSDLGVRPANKALTALFSSKGGQPDGIRGTVASNI
jgi:hypothetical protein